MNDECMNECRDLCEQAYLRRAGLATAPAGFDPTIIAEIITMLLELCKKPAAELKAAASNPSWAQLLQVETVTRMTLRRKHGLFAFNRFQGNAIVQAIFEVGASAPLEKVEEFCRCCCVD
jgi:hypothetical protein